MKLWQGLLIFTTGAAAGAVGSLFYLRAEFKKKVDEEISARDMAIRELKREKEKSDREAENANREIDSKVSERLSKALGYSEDNVSVMVRKPRRERSGASESVSERRKDVVYSVDENGEVAPSEPPDDLEPITSEDFLMTRKEYDKTTLIFYEKDGVLSNEDGDVVEDPPILIGESYFWRAQIGKSEDDIAYIRNNRVATDYEIVCEDKAYKEEWAT